MSSCCLIPYNNYEYKGFIIFFLLMNITKKNYLESGYTGLTNLGNTCFLNSCVQILTHTMDLHNIFENKIVLNRMETNKGKDETIILEEWKTLSELMWSGNGVVRPLKFVTSVQQVARRKNIEIFTGFAQNDVTEFLRFVVNCFHTTIARPVKVSIKGKVKTHLDTMALKCCNYLNEIYSKEYSEIYDMFYGISVTEIRSSEILSQKPEHYFIIDLPIPVEKSNVEKSYVEKSSITLHDCFDLFVKEESMNGENQWFNEKTGQKEDVVRRNYFWNFPKILVITLKRFLVDYRNIRRLNHLVDCPLEGLDLSKYVEGYNSEKYIYDLYGVSNHMGGSMGGHYTSYIKTEKGWVHFNDESLARMESEPIITPMAYCLFYKLR
jgi:ubiquitin C-terminal hydrolase